MSIGDPSRRLIGALFALALIECAVASYLLRSWSTLLLFAAGTTAGSVAGYLLKRRLTRRMRDILNPPKG